MDTTRLKDYFTVLQSRIVKELEAFDGQSFRTDAWDRPEGGGGKSRLIEEGDFFERGGVNFSHVTGSSCLLRPPPPAPRWPGAPGRRNSDDDSTPVSLLPPVGLKEGVVTDVREGAIEWTMWWFNPNNTADLPVFIYDSIPVNSFYRPGTVSCTATGARQCLSATYNAALNRIEVLAIIAPDFGAAPDSQPEALSNEILIRFTATSVASGTRYNQGLANWDENNNGDPLDDRDDGQEPVVTDDPVTPDPDDPTGVPIQIVRVIPTFGESGRALLLLSIALLGGLALRRRLH